MKDYVGAAYEIAETKDILYIGSICWMNIPGRDIPIYGEKGEGERYNRFRATMLNKHSGDGKKYLYDILE